MTQKYKKLIEDIKPEHNWDKDSLDPNVRCSKYMIKKSYYYDAIRMLKSWTNEDIENESPEILKKKKLI